MMDAEGQCEIEELVEGERETDTQVLALLCAVGVVLSHTVAVCGREGSALRDRE